MNMQRREDFYEDVYFHEMNKRESIYARSRLVLSISGLLASVSFWVAEKILQLILSSAVILDPLSLFAIGLSVSIFAYLFYCVYRSLVYGKYYEIPMSILDAQYDRLVKHYEKYHGKRSKQEVELMIREAFDKQLIKWIAKCNERNQNTNLFRSTYVTKCFNIFPLYLFALALLYALFYI